MSLARNPSQNEGYSTHINDIASHVHLVRARTTTELLQRLRSCSELCSALTTISRLEELETMAIEFEAKFIVIDSIAAAARKEFGSERLMERQDLYATRLRDKSHHHVWLQVVKDSKQAEVHSPPCFLM